MQNPVLLYKLMVSIVLATLAMAGGVTYISRSTTWVTASSDAELLEGVDPIFRAPYVRDISAARRGDELCANFAMLGHGLPHAFEGAILRRVQDILQKGPATTSRDNICDGFNDMNSESRHDEMFEPVPAQLFTTLQNWGTSDLNAPELAELVAARYLQNKGNLGDLEIALRSLSRADLIVSNAIDSHTLTPLQARQLRSRFFDKDQVAPAFKNAVLAEFPSDFAYGTKIEFQPSFCAEPLVFISTSEFDGNYNAFETTKTRSELLIEFLNNSSRPATERKTPVADCFEAQIRKLPTYPSGPHSDWRGQLAEVMYRREMKQIPNSAALRNTSYPFSPRPDLSQRDASVALHRLIGAKLASYAFSLAFHRRPVTLKELVDKGFLGKVPQDTFVDAPMTYDATKGVITSRGNYTPEGPGTIYGPIGLGQIHCQVP